MFFISVSLRNTLSLSLFVRPTSYPAIQRLVVRRNSRILPTAYCFSLCLLVLSSLVGIPSGLRTLFINLVEHLFSSFIIHLSSLPFLRLFVSPLFHNSIFPACGKQACSIYEIRNFSPPPLTVTQSHSLFTFSFLRPPYPPVGGGGGLLLS